MNMKFQPTPSVISPTQKLAKSTPDSAVAIATACSTAPVAITLMTPNRLMMCQVKKLGRNMPTICHWITVAASLKTNPQKVIASGVEVISKFMMP
jgi:hypothetical protein